MGDPRFLRIPTFGPKLSACCSRSARCVSSSGGERMSRRLAVLLLVAAGTLAIPVAVTSARLPEQSKGAIDPYKGSVGAVKLGMTRRAALSAWGPATFCPDGRDDACIWSERTDYNVGDRAVLTRFDRRTVMIALDRQPRSRGGLSGFKTRNVGLGSSFGDVKRAFPQGRHRCGPANADGEQRICHTSGWNRQWTVRYGSVHKLTFFDGKWGKPDGKVDRIELTNWTFEAS